MNDDFCPIIDPYGFLWVIPCGTSVPDPCVRGTAMYALAPCTAANPPLAAWCATYPTHPVCVNLGLPQLPHTGAPGLVLPVTAFGLLVAGLLCLLSRRFRCR